MSTEVPDMGVTTMTTGTAYSSLTQDSWRKPYRYRQSYIVRSSFGQAAIVPQAMCVSLYGLVSPRRTWMMEVTV